MSQAEQAILEGRIAILDDFFQLSGQQISVSGTAGLSKQLGIELAVAGTADIADLQELVGFIAVYLCEFYEADTITSALNVLIRHEQLTPFKLSVLPQTDGVRHLYQSQLQLAPLLPDFQHVQITLYDPDTEEEIPGQLILR